MRIAIGSDHAGFALKSHLVAHLRAAGHDVLDAGTDGETSVDYPAFCAAVARAVASGAADRGIVMGGSGQGEQLAANGVRGIRAALCNDLYTARMSRLHNDANVLVPRRAGRGHRAWPRRSSTPGWPPTSRATATSAGSSSWPRSPRSRATPRPKMG